MKSWVLIFLWSCSGTGLFAQSFLSYPAHPQTDITKQAGGSSASKARVLGQMERSNTSKEAAPDTPTIADDSPVTFDQAGLGQIQAQVNAGELNLALNRLNHLDSTPLASEVKNAAFLLPEQQKSLEISIYFKLGRYQEVISLGRAFLARFSGGPHFQSVYAQFSKALNAEKLPLELTYLVDQDFFRPLSPREAAGLRGLLINDALKRADVFDAFGYLQEAEGELIDGYEEWVGLIVDRFDSHDDMDDLIEQFWENPWFVARLKLRKIQLWVRSGRYDKAQEYLNELLGNQDLDPKLYAQFVALGSFVENARSVKPYRIGVILPFSHRSFGRLAREVQEGLEIGFARFSTVERPIELVFKDSAFAPLSALKTTQQRAAHVRELVRELAIEDKVIAILGPLAKGTSVAAGEAAGTYKLPLISFSLTENLGEGRPYLFRYQRNDINEARSIAQYATDYLQAKRFIVLYQPSKTGFRRMQAFVDEVKQHGGEIVGMRPVDRRQVDFQQDFLSFTGGFEPISDEDKWLMEKTRDRLEPDVDFDAIYAPVDPYTMNILTQFASLFDADKSYLLGGHELNQVENQVVKASSSLRFADTYPVSGMNTYLLPFFEEHWRLFNHDPRYRPPTAYGIYGYEALEILAKTLNNPENHNREALRDALSKLQDFKVLTGEVTTLSGGELHKPTKILKIMGRNTVEVF